MSDLDKIGRWEVLEGQLVFVFSKEVHDRLDHLRQTDPSHMHRLMQQLGPHIIEDVKRRFPEKCTRAAGPDSDPEPRGD